MAIISNLPGSIRCGHIEEGKHCGTFQKQNTFIPACLTEAKIGVNRPRQIHPEDGRASARTATLTQGQNATPYAAW
jgi:hypothetical protein